MRFVVTILLFAAPMVATGRQWTDVSGTHRIEAAFVSVSNQVVRLRRPDGTTIDVPLDRLSEGDREYVQRLMSTPHAVAALDVLRRHCHSCHGEGGTGEGGMNFALDLQRLVATSKILPGDPNASPLLQRIVDGEMPPEDVEQRLTPKEIADLRAWIDAGAPAVPDESRAFVNRSELLTMIRGDLESVRDRDRRFTRYFTITHLYNANRSTDELQTYRLALAKLINSLSWERQLVRPEAIDPAKTIFRVDVRDLRWSREVWNRILARYPYGVRSGGRDFATITNLTGSRLPFVRGDWFVAVASKPPLYHEVLQLPDSAQGLQQLLKISFSQDIAQERVARAGFNQSGVSVHPRIIERHSTSDGSCWVSYDFAGGAGDKNFFTRPLDFAADGGEIIFSLANGLQAYFLTDAAGNRLDKAPTAIVKDPSQFDGAVVNGVSCMRCHAAGMIRKKDEVRNNVLVNETAFRKDLETIKALYPEPPVMEKWFEEDQRRFTDALAKLGITKTSVTGEPVFNMARRFEDELDVQLAAAELGLTADQLTARIAGRVDLQRQIGVLRTSGGTMKRDAFQDAFGSLVVPLGLGSFLKPDSLPVVAGGLAAGPRVAVGPRVIGAGKAFAFRGRAAWPPYLESSKALVGKDGLSGVGRNYIRTKKGDFLNKDFVFEVLFSITESDSIIFVGLGEGRGAGSYKEPGGSVNFRIHPPVTHKGEVALSKSGPGGEGVGRLERAGKHRAVITKRGKAVTFAIDVDNDGESPDDIERTIAEIQEFLPTLHTKNTHLFFGGGGTFHEVKLTLGAAAPPAPPVPRADPAPAPGGPNLKPITRRTSGFHFANAMLGKDGLVVKPRAVVKSKRADFLRGDFQFDLVLKVPASSARQPLDRPIFIGIGDGSYDRLHEVERCVRLRINPPGHFQGDGSVNVGRTGADGRLVRDTVQEIGQLREAGTHRISIIGSGSAVTFAVDVDNDGESPDDFESTIPNIADYAPFLHTKNSSIFFGGDAIFTHVGVK